MNWTFARENMNSAGKFTVDDDVVSIIGSATRSTHQEKFSLNADTGSLIDFQGVEPAPNNVGMRTREQYGDFVFYLTERGSALT